MNNTEWLFYDIWSNNKGENLLENLKDYESTKHIKNILIFAAQEFVYYPIGKSFATFDYNVREFEKILKERDITLHIVLGANPNYSDFYETNPTFPKVNTKYYWWPEYWIYHTYNWLKMREKTHNREITIDNVDIMEFKIDKLFISLNNQPHFHRIALMNELCKNNLFDYGNISWNIRDLWKVTPGIWEKEGFDANDLKCWWDKEFKIDECFSSNGDSYKCIPLEYKTSLINLIPESTTDTACISEKTFTAIFLNQPFIICGPRGIHRALETLGFELYDEIFDYEFDMSFSLKERIDGVIKNLNNIKDKEYNETRKILEPKIKRNKKRIMEIISKKQCIPEFIHFLRNNFGPGVFIKNADSKGNEPLFHGFGFNFIFENTNLI